MVFWNAYLNKIVTDVQFESHKIEKIHIHSPTGQIREIITCSASLEQRMELRQYLKKYFGNPPHTPVLDIPETKLIEENDYMMIVREQRKIIGCIRYHYIGQFDKEPIYVVDCFCIHPQWRKKGVGDYLLTELHIYSNKHNKPHCVFLKEGQRLSILHSPFYTGVYAYRELTTYIESPYIHPISIVTAYRLLNLHMEFNPQLFIIRNSLQTNQYWKLYKKGVHSIMMCVQDTYQRVGKKKIGWITAWIESPLIVDDFREDAILAVSNMLYPMFDYVWINQRWINQRWIIKEPWKIDGTFHWYLYQWTTNCSLERSYVFLQ